MRVRQPRFDFSQTRPHWAPNVEFAQMQNATSLIIPYLERFLNKVMAKARQEIKGDDAYSQQVRADISTFIKQESCHYSTHDAYNEIIRRCPQYTRLPEFEEEIAAHYDYLLKNKSLGFLTAYCEGFETLGPPAAMAWCSHEMDDLIAGSDPNVAMMWRWHTMEEFEHRHVCHDVFHKIHGGYFLRVYAFFYQARFMFSMSGKIADYILSIDRASMSAEEVALSVARHKAAKKKLGSTMLKGIWKVFLPSYRPHTIAVPTGWVALEKEIDDDWIPAKAA